MKCHRSHISGLDSSTTYIPRVLTCPGDHFQASWRLAIQLQLPASTVRHAPTSRKAVSAEHQNHSQANPNFFSNLACKYKHERTRTPPVAPHHRGATPPPETAKKAPAIGDPLTVYHYGLDGKFPKIMTEFPIGMEYRVFFNGEKRKVMPTYGEHWSFGNPVEHYFFTKGSSIRIYTGTYQLLEILS